MLEKKEIMLCGRHYFITTLKTKIDVIILSRFKTQSNPPSEQHGLYYSNVPKIIFN